MRYIPGKFCLQHSRTATDDMNEAERKRSNNSNGLNTMLLNVCVSQIFFCLLQGVDTVERLNESGELRRILEPYQVN